MQLHKRKTCKSVAELADARRGLCGIGRDTRLIGPCPWELSNAGAAQCRGESVGGAHMMSWRCQIV
eukprot:354166-Rhodomonas_salina.2